MVKLLLTKGSAGLKEVRNFVGKTSYDATAEGGHGRLFDMLKLADGLAWASRKGEARLVARMIDRGAAANGRDQHGWTALMRAGFKERVKVMKALLEKRAEVDARDEEGYTALHCAVEAGQVEAVELLVVRTMKGVTAMQIANSLGYAGMVRILSQGGAARYGGPVIGINGVNFMIPVATEKQKQLMGGKKKT